MSYKCINVAILSSVIICIPGSMSSYILCGIAGTTNGDAWSSWVKLTERAEPLHTHCCSIWRHVYWCIDSVGRFHGSNWFRDRDSACSNNHLSVLWNIRKGKSQWAWLLWILSLCVVTPLMVGALVLQTTSLAVLVRWELQ